MHADSLLALCGDQMSHILIRITIAFVLVFMLGIERADSHQEVSEKYREACSAADAGEFEKAEKLFLECLKLAETMGESAVAIDFTKYNLASNYYRDGKSADAFSLCTEINKHFDEYGEKEPNAQTRQTYEFAISLLAQIYCERGDFSTSEKLFLKAMAIDAKSGGLKDPACIAYKFANLYISKGKLRQAEGILIAVIDKNKGREEAYRMRCEILLGACYIKDKRYSDAEKHTNLALNYYKHFQERFGCGSPLGEGLMLAQLAESLRLQNKTEDSIPIFKQSIGLLKKSIAEPGSNELELIKQSNPKRRLFESLNHYAAALRAMKLDDEAIAIDKEAQTMEKGKE
jgi:tetratricopeptide (TPR) repeat protein